MVTLDVNGRPRQVDVPADTMLLFVLRNDLGLAAAKLGCGLGQCGACTVLVNGVPKLSCSTKVSEVAGGKIVTLEGLGDAKNPDPLQKAFIAEQAAQCGFCMNGMIMSAKALLAVKPKPTEAEVRSALDANLCRCGSHNRIVRAVMRAAAEA